MAKPYIHLHRHDQHSLYDGYGTPKHAAEHCAEHGVPGLGLTNHGNVSGLVEHYYACLDYGIKPVLGMEGYMVAAYPAKERRRRYHITLLALDFDGWRNLMLLAEESNSEEAFYFRPTVTLDLLARRAKGIACFTGCPAGAVSQALFAKKREVAESIMARMHEIFGDRMYVELQSTAWEGVPEINEILWESARKWGYPAVMTHDAHFIAREDYDPYSKLMNLHRNDDMAKGHEQFYLMSAAEARKIGRMPGPMFDAGLAGQHEVLDRTTLKLEDVNPRMPVVDGALQLIQMQCTNWLSEWGLRGTDYEDRLRKEIKIIESGGMASYFCIVQSIVKWAHENGIRTGPGRGSVGGSLLAYALGITSIDPVRQKISFARFLRPDRKVPPDIDLDFDSRYHDKVLEHAMQEWGAKPIASYGYYRHRNLVNDLCKIYGDQWRETLDDMEQDAESGGSGPVQEAYRRTIASVRYMGKHPGGVVISDPRDYWMFPTMLSHGNRVSAFDMFSTERLGGLKVDLLGLQTVAVLSRLEKTTGNRPDETCSDRKVWDFICEGDLDGCFQFEERTAKEIVVSIQPRTIEDLAVCTSVNRPGPLELGYPEKYVELKGAKVEGWREYFEDTRGLPLYQDQIWVFLQEVARFTPDDADKVMKIMKGGNVHAEARVQSLLKRRKELEAKFIENVRGEYSPRQAKEMWDAIIQYAFNKAHAVAYATVGYQTAWYKCYYPLEFAHSLLVQRPKYPDCAKALQIAWRSGVVVMPPHVNASMGFTVEEDGEGRRFIRRGYSSVKGVGPAAAQKIKHGAPYSDWSDFDERSGVPSNAVQSLEEAGALYWPGRDDDKIAAAERAFREQTMRLNVSRKKVKTYHGT